jgi:hypothetical protein
MKSDGLEMQGEFIVEKVSTLPAWAEADEGRAIYIEDVDKFYIGNNSEWVEGGGGGTTNIIEIQAFS